MSTLFGYEVVEQAQEIDRLSTEIASLTEENTRLREAVKNSQNQFQFYADEHRLAGKTEKAQTNQAMADRCGAALQPKEGEG